MKEQKISMNVNDKGAVKITANRQNAEKSTGPNDTTSTRFNALKHGLLSEGITELDDVAAFTKLCSKLESELKPVGEIEFFFTRRIALNMQRLKRACLLEAEYTTEQLNPAFTKSEGGIVEQEMEKMHGKTIVLDPGLPARMSAEEVDCLVNRYQRYETAIENKLIRSLNQLERMQRIRQGEKISAPANLEVNVHTDNAPLASFGNRAEENSET